MYGTLCLRPFSKKIFEYKEKTDNSDASEFFVSNLGIFLLFLYNAVPRKVHESLEIKIILFGMLPAPSLCPSLKNMIHY